VVCWTIPDGKVNKSSVSCITITDLTSDGKEELVVAREDGRVEVYAQVDVTDDMKPGLHLNRPQLVFSSDIGEKVQSLVVGRVNSSTYNEIVVATYVFRSMSLLLSFSLRCSLSLIHLLLPACLHSLTPHDTSLTIISSPLPQSTINRHNTHIIITMQVFGQNRQLHY
jgi:hypothetical protein